MPAGVYLTGTCAKSICRVSVSGSPAMFSAVKGQGFILLPLLWFFAISCMDDEVIREITQSDRSSLSDLSLVDVVNKQHRLDYIYRVHQPQYVQNSSTLPPNSKCPLTIHMALKDLASTYPNNFLHLHISSFQLHSVGKTLLFPNNRTKHRPQGHPAFCWAAPTLWNVLPPVCRGTSE